MKKVLYFIFYVFACAVIFYAYYWITSRESKTINQPVSKPTAAETITIQVDQLLKPDLKKIIDKLNSETLLPIDLQTDASNPDMIISLDSAKISNNWHIEELYTKNKDVIPKIDSNELINEIDDLIIYCGYENNSENLQLITNYLQKAFTDNPPQPSSLTFVGDIMLSRWVALRMNQLGFDYPFLETRDYLTQSDLTIGNLESPYSEAGPYQTAAGTMIFRHDPRVTPELKNAGFDIFNLANNHFGNAGQQGISFTLDQLTTNGLDYFGAGENSTLSHQPLIKEINGVKFAFLGYTDSSVTPVSYAATNEKAGLNLDDTNQMIEDIKNAKKTADFIIVSMHLGTEYQTKPNQKQNNFARSAIDAGADFIYGHHPHVIQSIEFYKNKPIFYSLGNFIFDQTSANTKQGLVINAKILYNKLVGLEIKSINIKNFAQPVFNDEFDTINLIKNN